jgi:hypothetical protein
MYILE